jgi:hypothetical protein
MATIISRCVRQDPSARYASAHELVTALGGGVVQESDRTPAATPVQTVAPARWWWQFHQCAAAIIYWLMIVPAWYARPQIGGAWGRTFFIATLTAVIVAANLRLHLWFTSRFYESELTWVHDRSGRWIRAADWLFAGTLTGGRLLIGDEQSPLAILFPSVAVGAVVAFLLIEPVTARAAFRAR